jgi:hypothetical protein
MVATTMKNPATKMNLGVGGFCGAPRTGSGGTREGRDDALGTLPPEELPKA